MAKTQSFYTFYFSVIISGDSYLLEMIVTSLEGTLTQTRMGIGRVTLLCKGPMLGPNISALWREKNKTKFL